MAADYFTSSSISLILSWILCAPIILGLVSMVLSLVQKHENIPWLFSLWVGLCFVALSPLRYIFFQMAVAASYPFQSIHAFFTSFALALIIPIVFGILYAVGFGLPLFITFLALGLKSTPSKFRYFVSALLAPLLASIGSVLFSVILAFASLSTHWLRAEDLIRATNGPASYIFGYGLSPWMVALPPYISDTPQTVRDILRCHVAYIYLGESEHAKFLEIAYPNIYKKYSSAAQAQPSVYGLLPQAPAGKNDEMIKP